MPELPEVKTVTDLLNKEIRNKKIKKININLEKILRNIDSKTFKKIVENSIIKNVTNYGKWISINIENDFHILVHLRLEGKFRTILKGQNTKHDHIIFTFYDNSKLYFNDTRQFGVFELIKGNVFDKPPINKLANEAKQTDVNWLYSKLQRKRIPIKSSLLDQTLLVGLGNIYVNEVLWLEKIDPSKPSNLITKKQLINILKSSDKIMEESYKLGGSTIKTYVSLNNHIGKFQDKLQIHMREKKHCNRCNTIILKKKVGGRGTYFCPKCQN